MNFDEFRQEMFRYRDRAYQEARKNKDSNLAWTRLGDLYARFDQRERNMCEQVLREWLASEQKTFRSDARYLIKIFRIESLVPELNSFVKMMSARSALTPLDQNELVDVVGTLALLSSQGSEQPPEQG